MLKPFRRPTLQRSHLRSGASMIEVIISTFLVGTLLVTALSASAFHTANSKSLAEVATAHALAHRVLTEVQLLKFSESSSSTTIGIDSGETLSLRNTWDDMDDAHGYSASPPKTPANAARTGLTGWSEAISVGHVSVTNLSASSTPTGLKQITVTITTPSQRQVSASALEAELSAGDPSATSGNRLRCVEVNSTQFPSAAGPMVLMRNEPRNQ